MKKFKKIYIEITNICNLNCPFCSKDNRKEQEMSLDNFEHILKQINDYTDYLYLHIKGEPLIHSKIEDILNLCFKYNKQVNITTNGTLLSKKYKLLDKVRQINISLHSLSEDKLLDVLKCGDYLSSKGVQIVYRFWTNDNLLKQVLKYYDYKDEVTNNFKLKNNIYLNRDKEFTWPSLNNKFISDRGTCYGLKTHLGILVDGTVVPCCLDTGVINLGNVLKEEFGDILNKERTKNIITNFNNNKFVEELCQKCDFRK